MSKLLRIQKIQTSILILFLAVAIGAYLYMAAQSTEYPPLIDDAFIYLRFVRNFVRGDGIVWNPGEAPVEGVTSLLYFGLLVVIEKLGGSSIRAMPFIGVGAIFSILIMSWRLSAILNPGRHVENLLAITLMSVSPVFLHWSVSGFDIPLFTAVLLASALGYLEYQRQRIPAWVVGFLFALAALTRPEGLFFFGLTVGYEGVNQVLVQKKRLGKDILFMCVFFAILYLPVFIGRWTYFGYPFPNTYYTKTGGGISQLRGGITYLALSMFYIFAGVGIPLFLLLTSVKKIQWRKRMSGERIYIIVMILCSWGVVVVSGGDHFGYGRFLMPSIPFLFVMFLSVGLSEFFEIRRVTGPAKSLFLAVPLLVSLVHWQPWSLIASRYINALPEADLNHFGYYLNFDIGFIEMGKTLREKISEDGTIAVVPVGAIGYYSDWKVIDMVGLVDQFIAHQPFELEYVETWRPGHDKGDGLYVLSQQPDFIQFIDRLTTQPLPGLDEYAQQFKSLVEIWASPEFHSLYQFYPVRTTGGWYYNLYCRVDTLNCPGASQIPNQKHISGILNSHTLVFPLDRK